MAMIANLWRGIRPNHRFAGENVTLRNARDRLAHFDVAGALAPANNKEMVGSSPRSTVKYDGITVIYHGLPANDTAISTRASLLPANGCF
jgi:hypothetical protein